MTALPTHCDLRYAAVSPAQALDLFLPDTAGQPPLIVNIHGGAFLMGDKSMEARNITAQLAAGYAAASLNYRLSGEAVFPAAVQDAKVAVRWLRAQSARYGYDPDQIVIWGESAGGYLAQMVAITGSQPTEFDAPELGLADISAAVQAAVIWYAPNDFAVMDAQFTQTPPPSGIQPQGHDPADSPESLFLGAALPTVPELTRRANPLAYLATAQKLPPFSIAAGDQDHLVPPQQSIELARSVNAAGGYAELTLVPGKGHGSAVDEAQIDSTLDFLQRHLGPPATL